MMINFEIDKGCFNFRSVAVIIHDSHLLIHKSVKDDFWALPGGRVEFLEHSQDTIPRELYEEIGLNVKVERQLWYVENFFAYQSKKYYEISNYFLVKPVTDADIIIDSNVDFKGIEETVELTFRWVPLESITDYNLKPDFLLEKLNQRLNQLPDSIEVLNINQINV